MAIEERTVAGIGTAARLRVEIARLERLLKRIRPGFTDFDSIGMSERQLAKNKAELARLENLGE